MLEFGTPLEALTPLATRIAHVSALPLALALVFQLLKVGVMGRVWHGVVRSALPGVRIGARDTLAPYLAGVGINAVVPAKAGFVARAVLAKRHIPGATYETLAGTMAVESLLGLVPMAALLAAGFGFGVLPGATRWGSISPSALPHPSGGVLTVLALAALAAPVGTASLRRNRGRLLGVARRLRLGAAIFTDGAALGRALLAEFLAWGLRLACVCAFLAAFGLNASPRTVLLVVIVQVLSSLLPVAPNGAGAQQGLMVLALAGVASPEAILAFAIGMQAAIAILDVLVGIAALAALGVPRGLLRSLRQPLVESAVTPSG